MPADEGGEPCPTVFVGGRDDVVDEDDVDGAWQGVFGEVGFEDHDVAEARAGDQPVGPLDVCGAVVDGPRLGFGMGGGDDRHRDATAALQVEHPQRALRSGGRCPASNVIAESHVGVSRVGTPGAGARWRPPTV